MWRGLVVVPGLLALWQAAALAAGGRSYILPGPLEVGRVLVARWDLILGHAAITAGEMLAGLALGILLGMAAALTMARYRPARRWLTPLLVVSQAIPVFAIAPVLVLWFGYGLASKIVMAALIIFFPVATAFFDGLRRTEPGWLELARSMNAKPTAVLLRIRLPAALPALASGIRVAVAVAPIGAVIGEWVGASAGLGYLMLQANARMQVALMFAALAVLAVIAVLLYLAVDRLLRLALPWQADTPPSED